jgi:restriction endonuclease
VSLAFGGAATTCRGNGIAAFHRNKPINLHSQILANSAESLLELIRKQLAPEKFESLIAWYFQRIGATEVTIPPKNDSEKQGDADIIAVFEPLKTIYYVQAKHHKGDTGAWAAEQIKDLIANKDRMDDDYSKSPGSCRAPTISPRSAFKWPKKTLSGSSPVSTSPA